MGGFLFRLSPFSGVEPLKGEQNACSGLSPRRFCSFHQDENCKAIRLRLMLRFGVSISCSVLSGMSFAVTDLVPGHLHRKGSLSPSILTRSHSLNAVSFACACGLRCRPCVAGLYPVTVIASQNKTRHSGKTGINGNTENRLKGMNMKRLYSGFRQANVIRKTRPLTNDELFRHVPSVFSEEKHASRSVILPSNSRHAIK